MVRAKARLERLQEDLDPFDAFDQALEGGGHRIEEFGGVGLAQGVRADVVGAHGPAPGEQPLAVEAKVRAQTREKLDAGGLAEHVAPDGFWGQSGEFGQGAMAATARGGLQTLVQLGLFHV